MNVLRKGLVMKKNTFNAIVDALLVIAMLGVMFVGVLLGFFVGRGDVPQVRKYLWGLHRHDWGDIHLIFSLVLVGLVILHFILHIAWARHTSKRLLGLHWVVTLIILFIITAGILFGSITWKRAHPGDWAHEQGLGRGRLHEEGEGFRRGEGRGRGQRRRYQEGEDLWQHENRGDEGFRNGDTNDATRR